MCEVCQAKVVLDRIDRWFVFSFEYLVNVFDHRLDICRAVLGDTKFSKRFVILPKVTGLKI